MLQNKDERIKLTFSAAIGVNCPYQDEFRRRMRYIAQYVKNVESHRVLL
jgi:hypothetical protein